MHWLGRWADCIGNYGMIGGILMFIFWIAVILVVIWLIKMIIGKHGRDTMATSHKSALDILKERYAKGEITKEQFDMMKKDIL